MTGTEVGETRQESPEEKNDENVNFPLAVVVALYRQ
jgi:hypothetical protein